MNTIEKIYNYYILNQQISTDTRKIKDGDIFFALKGDNFNGNEYADLAIEKGARYVIIDEGEIKSEAYIKVNDVLKCLQELARHHRDQFDIPFIAITGTNGKTTSKELINTVLSTIYKVSFTSGNLNNHIGVPLTILSIKKDTDIAIIEMGASHKGNIEELCSIANPTHGVITNIGKAHLEGFINEQGVLDTKTELYEHLRSINGKVWVNEKDSVLTNQAQKFGLNILHYNGPKSSIYLSDYRCNPQLQCEIIHNQITHSIQSNLFGEYNAVNICLATSIGVYFNISMDICKTAIESYIPTNNRSEIKVTKRNNTIILDAYNANPSSMRLAIKSFTNSVLENKVFILGDMLELGDVSMAEHETILNSLNGEFKIHLVGKEFLQLSKDYPSYYFHQDVISLKESLKQHELENHSFLIKGSRGIQLEKVTEIL